MINASQLFRKRLSMSQQRASATLATFVFVIVLCLQIRQQLQTNSEPFHTRYESGHRNKRSLLQQWTDESCIPEKRAVDEFPPDFMTLEQRKQGGILFHILVTLYMFGLLAVVCDDYFVLSLYHICIRLRLDKDVAGATFMAVGSSAPTLFIAIVAIFFTEAGGDVGLGTVVGSTIFNTLFIIGVCALATTVPLRITPWPLLRDSFAYTVGTVTLVYTVRDRKVTVWEAASFLVIYAFYIVLMYFNRPLAKWFTKSIEEKCGVCGELEASDDDLEIGDSEDFSKSPEKLNKAEDKSVHGKISEKNHQSGRSRSSSLTSIASIKDTSFEKLGKSKTRPDAQEEKTTAEDSFLNEQLAHLEYKQDSPFRVPEGILAKVTWILGFPVIVLFYITIPPCCKRRWSEWFLVTFAMSVMWMGTLSYVLVWMVCIIGDTYNIPDCVMGMALLAAGSSIPDVMASVIVVRQGMADMAISNAIGSNVFDLLCLGGPWLVKMTLLDPGTTIQIQSQSIMISAMLLIGSIIFTVLAIHLNNWRLEPRLGIIFLIVYFVFISLATLLEFLACPCRIEDFLPSK